MLYKRAIPYIGHWNFFSPQKHSPGFIWAIEYISSSFLFIGKQFPLALLLPIKGCLGCLYFLATVSKAVVSIYMEFCEYKTSSVSWDLLDYVAVACLVF